MNPDVHKGVFKLAVWITVTAGILLLILEPGTPSFWISIASLVIGVLLMGVIVLITRVVKGTDGK
ncbi:MAG: hypothetical protein GX998_00235 [Firmicutes bacterium]|nr:hypothetical protein [Bacillota bacterium]